MICLNSQDASCSAQVLLVADQGCSACMSSLLEFHVFDTLFERMAITVGHCLKAVQQLHIKPSHFPLGNLGYRQGLSRWHLLRQFGPIDTPLPHVLI